MDLMAGMWIVTALSAVVIFGFAFSKGIYIRRDWFFLLLLAQAFFYLHLGPTVAANSLNRDIRILYIYLQLSCLMLFEIPFGILYFCMIQKCSIKRRPKVKIVPENILLLSIAMILLNLFFIFVLIRNHLLFYRIGPAIAKKMVNIPTIDWFIYRGYLLSVIFFVTVLLVTVFQIKQTTIRYISLTSLILSIGTYFTYAVVNSRGMLLLGVMFIFGISMIWLERFRKFKVRKLIFSLTFIMILTFYGWTVTNNIRQAGDFASLQAKYFNPFLYSYKNSEINNFAWRINGIDLMAKITPQAINKGFAFGKAWRIPSYVIISQLFNRENVNKYKLSYTTTAKSYLMKYYTTDMQEMTDYYSCTATDAYGNFWIFGFPLLAWALAILCFYGTKLFVNPRSGNSLLLGIFILMHIFSFETEFISILLGWIKIVPLLLILILFNPIKISGSSNENVVTEKNYVLLRK